MLECNTPFPGLPALSEALLPCDPTHPYLHLGPFKFRGISPPSEISPPLPYLSQPQRLGRACLPLLRGRVQLALGPSWGPVQSLHCSLGHCTIGCSVPAVENRSVLSTPETRPIQSFTHADTHTPGMGPGLAPPSASPCPLPPPSLPPFCSFPSLKSSAWT